jgi:hypothetical protein
MSSIDLTGWDRLRHGGLLLDTPRLRQMADHVPEPLPAFYERELRRQASALLEGRLDVPSFATLVLEKMGSNRDSSGMDPMADCCPSSSTEKNGSASVVAVKRQVRCFSGSGLVMSVWQ